MFNFLNGLNYNNKKKIAITNKKGNVMLTGIWLLGYVELDFVPDLVWTQLNVGSTTILNRYFVRLIPCSARILTRMQKYMS